MASEKLYRNTLRSEVQLSYHPVEQRSFWLSIEHHFHLKSIPYHFSLCKTEQQQHCFWDGKDDMSKSIKTTWLGMDWSGYNITFLKTSMVITFLIVWDKQRHWHWFPGWYFGWPLSSVTWRYNWTSTNKWTLSMPCLLLIITEKTWLILPVLSSLFTKSNAFSPFL